MSNIDDFTATDPECHIYNSVSYCRCLINGEQCVIIYGLWVHPNMRKKGIATSLLTSVIAEIKEKYVNTKIVAKAEPFGKEFEDKMDVESLKRFYAKHGVDVL